MDIALLSLIFIVGIIFIGCSMILYLEGRSEESIFFLILTVMALIVVTVGISISAKKVEKINLDDIISIQSNLESRYNELNKPLNFRSKNEY